MDPAERHITPAMIRSLPNCRRLKAQWSSTPPSGSTNHAFSLISPLPHHYSLPPCSISFNCTPVTFNTGLLTSHPFMPGHRHYSTPNFQGLPTGPAQPSGQHSALLIPKTHFLWLQPVHSLVLRHGLFFPSSPLYWSSKDSPSSSLPATKTQSYPIFCSLGTPLYSESLKSSAALG